MTDRLQRAARLIKCLTPVEKELIYQKTKEEISVKLRDFLDPAKNPPGWVDS